jgi:hypothetical protein
MVVGGTNARYLYVMTKPLKLYRASSVHLWRIDPAHRANNGSNQVSVLARCATKRRFAEIIAAANIPGRAIDKRDIDSTYRYISTYCCVHIVTPEAHSHRWARENAAAVKPETLYYNPQHHTKAGSYVDEWFELPTQKEKES